MIGCNTRAARPVRRMKARFCALGLCVMAMPLPAAARHQASWDTASSVGAYGLTALAIGLPLVERDKNGALQALGSAGAAELTAQGLKEIFPETRPDGSNRKSFPSGHTSLAFASAASLYNRQGSEIGVPALAVAAFVGVARVKADKHHWFDVVVGAGIGSAAGLLITHDRTKSAVLIPWGDTKGGGVSLAMRF